MNLLSCLKSPAALRGALAMVALAATTWPASAAGPATTAERGDGVVELAAQAAAYCRSTGGVVELRKPMINTNANSADDFAPLAGKHPFCAYTSADDGSMILVSLTTLYSTTPSQAALAYVDPAPFDGAGCFGNPAACYCAQIGGAGNMAAATASDAGGWVLKGSTYETVASCTFSDGSMIDQWGLTYRANGIVRGKDLNTVLRLQLPGKGR